MKILFFSTNGLGLGHTTRTVSIARNIRKKRKNVEILFLTSLESTGILFREGFPSVKIPGKNMGHQLNWDTYIRLCQSVILDTLNIFKPDILVVDTFESGVFSELLSVFEWKHLKKVFIYRERKDEMKDSGMLQALLPLYDLVVIPHEPNETNISITAGVNHIWAGAVSIRNQNELKSKEELRLQYNYFPDDLICFVSFGGGGDKEIEELNEMVISVSKRLKNRQLKLIFFTGSLYRGQTQKQNNIEWIKDYYPLIELLPMADFVISAGGYNSYTEIMATNTPTIFFTMPRKLDTQDRRVDYLYNKKACFKFSNEEELFDSFREMQKEDVRNAIRQKLSVFSYPIGQKLIADSIIALQK